MLHLFSADKRIQTWRRLWVALARAEHNLGLPVTEEQVAELEAHITDNEYKRLLVALSSACLNTSGDTPLSLAAIEMSSLS